MKEEPTSPISSTTPRAIRLTAFADDASCDVNLQINAVQALGCEALSARMIGQCNIDDVPEVEFFRAADRFDVARIVVTGFGSLLDSWSQGLNSDFAITVAEVERCVPNLLRLGAKLVFIIPSASNQWGESPDENEHIRRLRIIVNRFAEEGIVAAHENCMNWDVFSAAYSLCLLEGITGLKLIFDIGKPAFQRDLSEQDSDGTFSWQGALEFWEMIRDHLGHIHVKVCLNSIADGAEPNYTLPGEGSARVRAILEDAFDCGYDGWIAIEPHVATVFHCVGDEPVDRNQCNRRYIQYGRNLEALIE